MKVTSLPNDSCADCLEFLKAEIEEPYIIGLEFQNAVGVGYTAIECFEKGEVLSPNELLPFYLRLPQAERELKLKKERGN